MHAGLRIRTADTIGIADTDAEPDFVERSICDLVLGCAQGINAILVVCSLRNRMTAEEINTIYFLFNYLFPGVVSNAVLVFTHADLLPGDEAREAWVDRWRRSAEGGKILSMFSNRYVFFDSTLTGAAAERQRAVFFRYVRDQFPVRYTSHLFREAQTILSRRRAEAKELAEAPAKLLAQKETELLQLRQSLDDMMKKIAATQAVPVQAPHMAYSGGGGGGTGEKYFEMAFGAVCAAAVGVGCTIS